MIAIVGDVTSPARAAGPGTLVAPVGRAAVAAGAAVEVVGVVAEGAEGDRDLVGLARDHLGHAAVLRSSARSLEPADLGLALRYLPDLRVLVLLGVAEGLFPAAIDGAAYAGATLLVVTAGEAIPDGLPTDAVVIQAPGGDGAGTFAGLIGSLAARLDAGALAAAAWAETADALAVQSSSESLPERARIGGKG